MNYPDLFMLYKEKLSFISLLLNIIFAVFPYMLKIAMLEYVNKMFNYFNVGGQIYSIKNLNNIDIFVKMIA